jgi:hypothetical protein
MRLPTIRSTGRLIQVLCIASLVAACGHQWADEVAALEADFPAIEQLHVNGFTHLDECGDYLDYPRGVFVTDPGSSCYSGYGGTGERQAFDDQARADLETMVAATEANGPRLQSAFVTYLPDGAVGPNSTFSFTTDYHFVYRPSADNEYLQCAIEIGADWYKTCS